MGDIVIKKAKKLTGAPKIPGDKSISHRAALISLLCREPLELTNFNDGADCASSLAAIGALGAEITRDGGRVSIKPPERLKKPEAQIDCGNSGTTMRLLAGILAGSKIDATLTGDESLTRRPMKRIIEPLKQMNAMISGDEGDTAPLYISSSQLIGMDYTLPVASAQVKSALILAGVASSNRVVVREGSLTRDHTERMIKFLGGEVRVEDLKPQVVPDEVDPRKKKRIMPTEDYVRSIEYVPSGKLNGGEIGIPGDISTAAFFIAAALLVPGSHLILKDVGINPTRIGFVNLLKQMGADIKIKNRRENAGEPAGDIEVSYSKLKPRKISGDTIPNMIDELPLVAMIAATVEGTTIVRDAAELRHKESDRIKAVTDGLLAMNVKVGEFPDGFAIEGGGDINGAEIDSHGDHRIAMAFAVLGLVAHGMTAIKDADVVNISCPEFFPMLEGLRLK